MKLTLLSDGRYCKNLGFTENAQHVRKQSKFYLGRDHATAMIRAGLLEKFWAEISAITTPIWNRPCWVEGSLPVAQAIASGIQTPEARNNVLWYTAVQVGAILGEKPHGKIVTEKTEPTTPTIDPSQTLHLALRDYITNIQQKYPTQWGGAKVRMTEFLIEHSENSPLGRLGTNEIEAVIERIVGRPANKKTVEPISVAWAKNVIK